jgi:hypothetical protein
MSNTSKETLRAEIAKLCAEKGKALPEGLDEMKQIACFDALEALTGVKDQRRPSGPPAGAVRANSEAPPAAAAPAAAAPGLALEPAPAADPDSPKSEPEPEAAAPAPAAEQPQRFRVAEGRMIVCVPGPLGAFQEIRAIDLAGGQEELDGLLAAGAVEPVKR